MCLNGCSWLFPALGSVCQTEEPSKSSLCLTLCLGLWAEFSNLLNTLTLFSWIVFSNTSPLWFFDLLSWTLWLLNTCVELWTSKLDTVFHIPFSISTLKDCVRSFGRTSHPNHAQLKNPWFLPSPLQICWCPYQCGLCLLESVLVVLVPRAIQSPLYCRLCLLIIQPLL